MTKQEKIISFLRKKGLDIRPYIRYDYETPGTIVISSGSMFGYGGHYDQWLKLLDIVKSPTPCPVEMHRIMDKQNETSFKYLITYDRLVWNNETERKMSHE